MKLSDYIARLQKIHAEHGDIDVVLHVPGRSIHYGNSEGDLGVAYLFELALVPEVALSGTFQSNRIAIYGRDPNNRNITVDGPVVTLNRPVTTEVVGTAGGSAPRTA